MIVPVVVGAVVACLLVTFGVDLFAAILLGVVIAVAWAWGS